MSAGPITTADIVGMLFEIGDELRAQDKEVACFVRDCDRHHPHPAIWRRTESSSDR